MSNTNNFSGASSQWFDLANDFYKTYIKSLEKGQERTLELTKLMYNQAGNSQEEVKSLLQEYTSQVERAQGLFQNIVRSNLNTGNEMVNQYRDTSKANLEELNTRLNDLQSKIQNISSNKGSQS